MSEVVNIQNTNSYYSNNPKAERKTHVVASAPENLPRHHLFNDTEANQKMSSINKDIYQASKKENKKDFRTFLKIFGGIVLTIFCIKNIRKFFKKS